MSNLIIPDSAKFQHLRNSVGLAPLHYGATMKLFSNNATISHATVLADLTVATFSGYSDYPMSGLTVAGALDGSGRATAQWTARTWTKIGVTGNTIYGYFVIDDLLALAWVEKFDTPVDMSADGAFIQITPKLTLASQFLNT